MIKEIIILTLIGSSPVPALPYIIFMYSNSTFYESLLIIIIANVLITFIQYRIGVFISNRRFFFSKLNNKISYLKNKFKKLTTKDLLLIKISNIFISKLINILAGYTLSPFKKILCINLGTIFIWHFFYYYISKKVDIIGEFFKALGLNISIVNIISILSISSLIYLALRVIKIFLVKFLKNKDFLN